MTGIPLTWSAREPPLIARAVGGFGEAALRLAQSVLRRSDDALARLEGVAAQGALVFTAAEAEDLPWADGVVYFGSDPAAPGLLMPVLAAPEVPAPLLASALRLRGATLPLIVLPEKHLWISLAGAKRPSRDALLRWLAPPGEQAL